MYQPTIADTPSTTVAYLVMTGPYDQIPTGLGTLYHWITRHGLTPAGAPGTAFLSDPGESPQGDAVFEVWAPIDEAPAQEPDSSGVGIKRVGPTLAATAVHAGPYESIGQTFVLLTQWVRDQGYEVSGPPMEFYRSDPVDTQPTEYETEVVLPVRKR